MRTLFQRACLWVVPFWWQYRASRVATATTLGISLANTLAHTVPWLLGHGLKHYNALPLGAVLLTIVLWVRCWCACLTHSCK